MPRHRRGSPPANAPLRAAVAPGRSAMKRQVISRYQHDKFSDWSTPGALAAAPHFGAASTRLRRLTPAARAVQCCVWILSVLGPASLVLGVVLLVRPRRRSEQRRCNAGRLGARRATAPLLTRAPRLRSRRAWRCATRPRPPSRRTTRPSGAPGSESRKGPPRPSVGASLTPAAPTPQRVDRGRRRL